MLSVLFINIVVMAGGIFIGYMRAKEITRDEIVALLKENADLKKALKNAKH